MMRILRFLKGFIFPKQPIGDNQERWLKALESGEFQQGKGNLTSKDSDGVIRHCCLGVQCAVRDLWGEFNGSSHIEYREGELHGDESYECSLPPGEVRYLGLYGSMGNLKKPMIVNRQTITSLTALNDVAEWSFQQIAQYCRENPENVFRRPK